MINKEKILIIHHGTGLGGGLIALLGLIDELKHDYEVSVFCIFKSNAIEYLQALNIDVYTPKNNTFYSKYNLFIHSEASYSNIPSFIKFLYYFLLSLVNSLFYSKNELKDFSNRFDILYLNSLFISDWLPYSKKFFKKVVVHVREPLARGLFGCRKNIFRFLLKKYADLIICVSDDNMNRIDIFNKSVRVYDPVVVSGRIKEDFEIVKDKNKKYFIYLGGSQRIKGFEQFIDCLEHLDDNVKIYFLGSLAELEENTNTISFKIRSIFSKYTRTRLQDLKTKFYNSDKIELIGKTDYVFNYYDAAVAVICPFSKPHACLPILEAYSFGKPVIVSDVEGMNEHLEDEIMKVFANNNSIGLAVQINKLANIDENYMINISKLAREKYDRIKSSNPDVGILLKEYLKEEIQHVR